MDGDFLLDLTHNGEENEFLVGPLDHSLLNTDFPPVALDLMQPPEFSSFGTSGVAASIADVPFKLDMPMKLEPMPSGFNRHDSSSVASYENDWSSNHSHSPSLTSESTPASPGLDLDIALPPLDGASFSGYSSGSTSPEPSFHSAPARRKRKAATKIEPSSDSRSSKSVKSTSAPIDKNLTKSERNRLSAQRYREKKKNEVHTLRAENDRLMEQNQSLGNQNRELRMELKTLRSLLENKKVRMFSLLFVLILCPILSNYAMSPSVPSGMDISRNEFSHAESHRPGNRVLMMNEVTADLSGGFDDLYASAPSIDISDSAASALVDDLDDSSNLTESDGHAHSHARPIPIY